MYYNPYSEYLKGKYGEKVYKLPVNLPVTCPNRIGASGCAFCAGVGTGFEACDSSMSITEQLEKTQKLIEARYHAKKYIAYFQNYTNTFLPISQFEKYIEEAAQFPGIVEISVSTRPDCIRKEYLDVLQKVQHEKGIQITVELGLQTANYHTLQKIHRGHGLAEFIDAVWNIKEYRDFSICAHVILNLPWDTMEDTMETARILTALRIDIVKLHSLYVAKNTELCEWYNDGKITICEKEEYLRRVRKFLELIPEDMVVERLFSRIPEDDAVFSNWQTSWWKLKDELFEQMDKEESWQGKYCNYLNGAALDKLHQM